MLGAPLLSCFKASGDTVKRPGARSLRGMYTLDCWPCGRSQSVSSKIRSRNLCKLPFRENWIPRKFPAIRYIPDCVAICHPRVRDRIVKYRINFHITLIYYGSN